MTTAALPRSLPTSDVHAAVGRIDGVEPFLQHAARMGQITKVEMHDVTVRQFDEAAIVSCPQGLHVAYVPGLPPVAIQAAVTRVWVTNGAGWQPAHTQPARRQPPG